MITDEAVAEFISLTNAQVDEARGYLEMTGGELQEAVNIFLEMGGGGGNPSPVLRPAPSPAAPMDMDADVAAEVRAAAAAAGIDMADAEMDDAEVRAPMASFNDQMIDPDQESRRINEVIAADTAAMTRRMAFDRPTEAVPSAEGAAQGQAINQLFAPPEYVERSTYYKTIEKAKAEGKWILVNIQQAEVFASHTLNRDVWNDETIKDVVQGSFIFWQRDDKSAEGEQFCQYHQCGHQLPHICVIDARTGRKVKSWDGRKWSNSHTAAEFLFGFLDEFSLSRSPPALSPAGSPVMHPRPPPPAGEGVDVELVGLDGDSDMQGPSSKAAKRSAEEITEAPKEPVAAMPEEPPETVEHLKVSFKLADGKRVTRRFLPTEPISQMFEVASALVSEPVSLIDLSTQYPKRSLRGLEGGLEVKMQDAQVAGNMVLINVRSS